MERTLPVTNLWRWVLGVGPVRGSIGLSVALVGSEADFVADDGAELLVSVMVLVGEMDGGVAVPGVIVEVANVIVLVLEGC